ncbi:HAD family hydrolase [Methanoregula sp.]|jgi:phosphoglycolate phosphatase-like HAD superfamily hydrolase|uniref:HAD family hydrolase n=1 Tax=Methanoregula sp. TaxID=2052170 RepID=UPI0025E6089B|nr:HAD hydrolase-like protein [Methanoregula sp.]
MISTIILDFDGVILESVSVKTEAFRELFSFEPDHVDEIVEFHKRNGGMSRFDKFRYIYSSILYRDLTDDQFRKLSDRFADIVFKKILRTPFVPGAREFLDGSHRKLALYVVSATPEDELRQIIERRGLTRCFRGVYGAPGKKADHIKAILSATHCGNENAVFIGDAINDLNAAKASGIRFIGRILPGEMNYFAGNPEVEHTISTLFELEKYIGPGTDT